MELFIVHKVYLIFLVGILLIGCGNREALINTDLKVKDVWIRELPPVAQVVAAYMVIENKGAQSVHLLGAECEIATRVEIHAMEHLDGMMNMKKLERVMVPASGQVVLKPDGTHLMLMGLVQAPRADTEVPLMLHFDNGITTSVMAKVRRQEPGKKDERIHD